MEQLLIKLSETHYIIVDNSEIKKGDYHVATRIIKSNVVNAIAYTDKEQLEAIAEIGGAKKITHSTQPLEIITALPDTGQGEVTEFGYNKIKPLSLSEVEEAINGYSVQKLSYEKYNDGSISTNTRNDWRECWKEGFKAHQELVKDKLFTIEQVKLIWKAGQEYWKTSGESITFEELIQRKNELLPTQTEWNIEFNEQGKLKVIWM